LCLAIQIEISQERRRMAVMPHQVGHENIEDVIVYRHGCTKAGHIGTLSAIPINEQRFLTASSELRSTATG
jgi:hypothetical protein